MIRIPISFCVLQLKAFQVESKKVDLLSNLTTVLVFLAVAFVVLVAVLAFTARLRALVGNQHFVKKIFGFQNALLNGRFPAFLRQFLAFENLFRCDCAGVRVLL